MTALKTFGFVTLLTVGLLAFQPAGAQTLARPGAPGAPPDARTSESGVRWQELSPSQRAALRPLEREWPQIDAPQKQKWLELSLRVPSMSADERNRVQARMNDWARLSPQERGRTRLNFEEAKQLPAKDRQARWEAYQALPPEQKRALAERAVPPPPGGARRGDGPAAERSARDVPQLKSNIVPNTTYTAPPRPVAPTVVQAQPGATTTLMSKRASPPTHQQPGMPKIAATPEFVDKATLLPRRGPQGAATRPASAAEPAPGAKRR